MTSGEDREVPNAILAMGKRPKLTFGIFFGFIIAAVLWGSRAPRQYEFSVIVQVPLSAIADTGIPDYDSLWDIRAKVESGAFDRLVAGGLGLEDGAIRFAVSRPRNTRLLKIVLERPPEEADAARAALSRLLQEIVLNHAEFMKDKRRRIDDRIKMNDGLIAEDQRAIESRRGQPDAAGIAELRRSVEARRVELLHLKIAREAAEEVVVFQKPMMSPQPVGPGRWTKVRVGAAVGAVCAFWAALVADARERRPARA